MFYGYDQSQKSYLGLSVEEERQRTAALAILINADNFDETRWTKPFRLGVNLNNNIYKHVYQTFYLVLAFTAGSQYLVQTPQPAFGLIPSFSGLLLSILMGVATSTFEFALAFCFRPFLRLFRMVADLLIMLAHIGSGAQSSDFQICTLSMISTNMIFSDILRPLFSLLFPWNKN
jgi:hypothetical protein